MVKRLKIKINRPIGFRMADIGPGGKEFNIEEDKQFKKELKELGY